MVATRHCCWGKCNNDSRYPERLPHSLKEMLKNGQKAFIPFPKPKHDLELCQRWVNACSRQNFSLKHVNYNTSERADPHEADARVTNLLPLVVHATSLFRERIPKKYFRQTVFRAKNSKSYDAALRFLSKKEV